MIGEVVSLAERRYRALVGFRCVPTLPDSSTIRGRALKGLYGPSGAPRRFRLRSRTVCYILLDYALHLRPEGSPC